MSELYDKTQLVAVISDELIAEMLEHMKPVVEDGGWYEWYREIDIAGVDPRCESFIWSPKVVGEAFTFDCLDRAVIPSFHTYGAPSLFKPSLAECLACINRYCPSWKEVGVKFFHVLDDLDSSAVIGSCHQTRINLFSTPMVVEGGGRNGKLVPLVREEVERE
mgnify:CR=1 FL=1